MARGQLMKLKKSRQVRTCYECKCTISKGDQYGQRTKRISLKATQEERDAVRPAILVESISVRRDICANCAS